MELGFKEGYRYALGRFLFLKLTDDDGDIDYCLRWYEDTPKIMLIDLFLLDSFKTISEEEFLKGYISIPKTVIEKYKEIMKKLEK